MEKGQLIHLAFLIVVLLLVLGSVSFIVVKYSTSFTGMVIKVPDNAGDKCLPDNPASCACNSSFCT